VRRRERHGACRAHVDWRRPANTHARTCSARRRSLPVRRRPRRRLPPSRRRPPPARGATAAPLLPDAPAIARAPARPARCKQPPTQAHRAAEAPSPDRAPPTAALPPPNPRRAALEVSELKALLSGADAPFTAAHPARAFSGVELSGKRSLEVRCPPQRAPSPAPVALCLRFQQHLASQLPRARVPTPRPLAPP